jgi:UDP-N-acetylglucosamine 2-epimerase (non-hydrolysing)
MESQGLLDRLHAGLRLISPVGYHDSLRLERDARLVITDSGGVQEETTFFRTPCLTLRPNTERPITVRLGSNRLTRVEDLLRDVDERLAEPRRIGAVPPLWDGRTGGRIVDALLESGEAG